MLTVWLKFRVGSGLLLLSLLAGCSAGDPARPRDGAAGVGMADAALHGGAARTALNQTAAILRSNPRDVGALVRQGTALAQLNQPDAAMEAYRRALAVDPTVPEALLGLGRIDLSRGDAADAERMFTRLLARESNDRTALNNLGVSLDLQARHAEAREVYAKLLGIEPDNRAASVNLALSLSLSGQAARSVEMLRGPGSRPDATPRVRQDLAMALALSGSPREAEKLLRTDLSPVDAAAALAGYEAFNDQPKYSTHR